MNFEQKWLVSWCTGGDKQKCLKNSYIKQISPRFINVAIHQTTGKDSGIVVSTMMARPFSPSISMLNSDKEIELNVKTFM